MTLATVETLYQRGLFDAIDLELARCISRLPGDAASHSSVVLAAAFASRAVQAGHVCLELPKLLATPLTDAEGLPISLSLPDLATLRSQLLASPWVTAETQAARDNAERTPLWIDADDRVYLQRYFDYQCRLIEALSRRAQRNVSVNDELLKAGLTRLFSAETQPNWQAAAAVVAVSNALAVISGGPGTGKTTTVAKILALLGEQAQAKDKPFRVVLVAPTGKAAQRLSQAIQLNASQLDTSDTVRVQIQQSASTIHRTLGFQNRSPNTFIHTLDNPISADVVVVDEASMVDIGLMTKLVEAVPVDAHLILLGDKDQLASVEAGAIFGDIYNGEVLERYTPAFSQRLFELSGAKVAASDTTGNMRNTTVHLSRSYRYDPSSAISALAVSVRNGDAAAAHAATRLKDDSVLWCDTTADPGQLSLRRAITDGYAAFQSAQTPTERLSALNQFRILAAHRAGSQGVQELNKLAEAVLGCDGQRDPYYVGRPIMVTANDYSLGLFNGDIGVIDLDEASAAVCAYFPAPDGLRRIHPSRLPPHETVFAMTVHKSQGSEFEQVAIVLPQLASPILTRELLYTAITRARQRVSIHGSWDVFTNSIQRCVQRASGLRSKLWR